MRVKFISVSSILLFFATLLTTPSILHAQSSFSYIAAGSKHSLALKADGSLWAWGYNNAGQLGDGSYGRSFTPKKVGEGFAAVAGGGGHSLGIKTDGSLWAWGWNQYGQLGDDSGYNQPAQVQIGEGFIAIDAGDKHSLAVKEDGSLWAWGSNDFGQLGDGTTTECHTPKRIGEGFIAVAAGDRHSVGLKADGTTRIWGGGYGSFPMQVGEGFIAIAAGETSALGLKNDGTVWNCRPPLEQVDEGYIAIAAGGDHSMGLKADGTLWDWGTYRLGNYSSGDWVTHKLPTQVGEGFIAIAAGKEHSLGLKNDGSIWTWGLNDTGQLGDGTIVDHLEPTPLPSYTYYVPFSPAVQDFDLGFGVSNLYTKDNPAEIHVEYFDNDGNEMGEDYAIVPPMGHASFMRGISPAESGWARIVSTEPVHGLALVFGYGEDTLFDMDFKADAANDLTVAHVDTADGWVSKAMLANPNSDSALAKVHFQPGSGGAAQTAELSIPAMGAIQYDLAVFGNSAGSLQIVSDQNLVGFLLYDGRAKGSNWAGGLSLGQTNPARHFVAMSAGDSFSLGLEDDGTLWAWGRNNNGQLGDGSRLTRKLPVQVGEEFAVVSAGAYHSLGVKTDGSLWAWGSNEAGQLGDGTNSTRTLPVQVGEGFAAIAAGGTHSLGAKTDGTLWAWGSNSDSQLGDGTVIDSLTPIQVNTGFTVIAAYAEHSLGLMLDGTLWAWGDNENRQLGHDYPLYDNNPLVVGIGYAAVATGGGHSLGVKTDGSLWTWGRWNEGQLGDGLSFWRYGRATPEQVDEGYTAIAAGGYHSLGLKLDGSLWAWGSNSYGQLGTALTNSKIAIPTQVAEGYAAVAAGLYHSLGLKDDGSLWSWGRNEYGQLGDGSMTDRSSPVRVGVAADNTPSPEGEYVYYVPYTPASADFAFGFGLSNMDDGNAADVHVEYFSNAGLLFGQETAAIPAGGHTSFMSGLSFPESCWARIVSDQVLSGMALIVGYDDNPMFDIDFKADTLKELITPHVDTRNGWVSKAMLANPGDVQAEVTVTFYPDDGANIQTVDLTIPAMGAVQYDLGSAFPGMAGAIRISSDQGLVGFLLYDGRGVTGGFSGFNYVGGLSMVPFKAKTAQNLLGLLLN